MMYLHRCLFLFSALLMVPAQTGDVQELLTSQEMVLKISSAGEYLWFLSCVPGSKLMQCSAGLDLLIMLDGSYSVGKGSFERCKHLVQRVCEVLDVGSHRVRVGVIQFGSTPYLEFPLDAHTHKEELLRSLKSITYRGGATHTALALKLLVSRGFPGGRNGSVPRVLLLLSDGRSQAFTQQPATQLKQQGVIVFAVGVRYPRWTELESLASLPTERHVLFAEHFSDTVNGFYSTLSSSDVCAALPTGCRIDSFPCVRNTLEKIRELQGNFMCWRGSKIFSPAPTLCPYYRWNKSYRKHEATCYRAVCPDPCDSAPCQNGGTCVSETLERFRCVCPPGYRGDVTCGASLSLECGVDVLFLLESSSRQGFLPLQTFLLRFLQAVLVNKAPVRVGVAQYGEHVQVEVPVGVVGAELLQVVRGMRMAGGSAQTGAALRYVTQHAFSSADVFADVRDDLPRVLVLLTHTPSADPVEEPARNAQDRQIFLIAMGTEEMKNELNNITGNPHRILTYSTAERLDARMAELQAKICSVDNQGCLGQPLDLVLVLDASAAVGRENFPRLLDFVRSICVQFDINRDVAQIALVTYGRGPVTAFQLDTHASGQALLGAVGGVAYMGGASSTGRALLHVHSEVLTVGRGARPGVNKAVVVVTDGAEDAAVPAQKIRDNGVALFVVGIGDVQKESLLRMVASRHHLLSVPSYEDLKYFDDVLVQMLCTEGKRPVDLCKPNLCMNDGICVLLGGSYRCECRGWEGTHCETRSTETPSRGDIPRHAAVRNTNYKNTRTTQ